MVFKSLNDSVTLFSMKKNDGSHIVFLHIVEEIHASKVGQRASQHIVGQVPESILPIATKMFKIS